jgi:nucleoid DNA-binding protein
MAKAKAKAKKAPAKKVAAKKAPAKKAAAKKVVAKKVVAKKAPAKKAAPAKKVAPAKPAVAPKLKVPVGLKTLTASQLVAVVAEQQMSSRVQAKANLESIFNIITAYVMGGAKVKLGELGTMLLAKRAARMGRNPQTGEPVKIKASTKLRFRQSRTAKDMLAKIK